MATRTKYRTVHIRINGSNINVRPRCGELQWGTNEQIKWVIDHPGLNFTVEFNKRTGSPFRKKVFTRRNNTSGPLIVKPKQVKNDRFYPYSMRIRGHRPIDPGIIIWK